MRKYLASAAVVVALVAVLATVYAAFELRTWLVGGETVVDWLRSRGFLGGAER
jgi:hypothetical protein